MYFSEVQDHKDYQDQNHYASHNQKCNTQEFVGATEGINLWEINVLLAIELRNLKFVIDHDGVSDASRKLLPNVAP